MARGKKVPALGQPLYTPRFVLQPIARLRMFVLQRRALADPELRGLMLQKTTEIGARRIWRRLRRMNGRKSFGHAIVDRASGKSIGYHKTDFIGYRTATCEVMIFDRRWWGEGVVIEARKALFVALHDHAEIRQFIAQVHTRNFASILNHRKMGMEHTGTVHMVKFDQLRDEPADYLTFSLRGDKLAARIEEWRHDVG
jgi:RimJ/RimL family protein N-acetyltransferase